MEWFVIYVFVMVERLAALLALGWVAFWGGIVLIGFTMMICAMQTENYPEVVTFTENIESRWAKFSLKIGKWSAIVGLILGIITFLIPTQKDLAIIVGSGVTYKAVTSETGKRLGGKAIDFLEQKLDNALDSGPTPTPTPAPAQPTPQPSGKAL